MKGKITYKIFKEAPTKNYKGGYRFILSRKKKPIFHSNLFIKRKAALREAKGTALDF